MKRFGRPHGLMFHHFHSAKYLKGQGSIDELEFKNIIEYYSRHYNVISADLFLQRFQTKALEENDVCITFDDSLKCQFEIALPVLKRLKLKAFWFLYSLPFEGRFDRMEVYRNFRSDKFDSFHEFYDVFFEEIRIHEDLKFIFDALADFDYANYLKEFSFYSKEDRIFRYTRDFLLGPKDYDRVMNSLFKRFNFVLNPELHKMLWINLEHVKELGNEGHLVGLHSHTHPTMMAEKTYPVQYEEYKKNKFILESKIKDKVISMSHPCNSYNDDTIEIMKRLGIKIGFRSNLNGESNSNYEIARIDHSEVLKFMEYDKKHNGLY